MIKYVGSFIYCNLEPNMIITLSDNKVRYDFTKIYDVITMENYHTGKKEHHRVTMTNATERIIFARYIDDIVKTMGKNKAITITER